MPDPMVPEPVQAPGFEIDPGLALQGAREFGGLVEFKGRCTFCHGIGALAAGWAPDLRDSQIVLSATAFANVVRRRSRVNRGMPGFPDLTDS
ncbi:MAG: hypothetical protein CL484_12995 [Acidobacteria bacterium]|nr:hypothetical protein [Acidobacteriota bacterium]